MNKLFILSMITIEVATAMLMSFHILYFLIPFLPKLSEFDMWEKCLFCGTLGSSLAFVLWIMGEGVVGIAKEIVGRRTK